MYSHLHVKTKWVYSQAIFILCLFIFTKNIYLNYTDVRTGHTSGKGEEGIQMYEPDVRQGVERGRKN